MTALTTGRTRANLECRQFWDWARDWAAGVRRNPRMMPQIDLGTLSTAFPSSCILSRHGCEEPFEHAFAEPSQEPYIFSTTCAEGGKPWSRTFGLRRKRDPNTYNLNHVARYLSYKRAISASVQGLWAGVLCSLSKKKQGATPGVSSTASFHMFPTFAFGALYAACAVSTVALAPFQEKYTWKHIGSPSF